MSQMLTDQEMLQRQGTYHTLMSYKGMPFKKAALKGINLKWLRSFFFILIPLMFFMLFFVFFFKYYNPQLTRNCCPCHMNYAAFDANSGSLALNKSKAILEPCVITNVL